MHKIAKKKHSTYRSSNINTNRKKSIKKLINTRSTHEMQKRVGNHRLHNISRSKKQEGGKSSIFNMLTIPIGFEICRKWEFVVPPISGILVNIHVGGSVSISMIYEKDSPMSFTHETTNNKDNTLQYTHKLSDDMKDFSIVVDSKSIVLQLDTSSLQVESIINQISLKAPAGKMPIIELKPKPVELPIDISINGKDVRIACKVEATLGFEPTSIAIQKAGKLGWRGLFRSAQSLAKYGKAVGNIALTGARLFGSGSAMVGATAIAGGVIGTSILFGALVVISDYEKKRYAHMIDRMAYAGYYARRIANEATGGRYIYDLDRAGVAARNGWCAAEKHMMTLGEKKDAYLVELRKSIRSYDMIVWKIQQEVMKKLS